MGSNKGKSRASRKAKAAIGREGRKASKHAIHAYSPTRLVQCEKYAESVWENYLKIYEDRKDELWTPFEMLVGFPPAARLWVIFATSVFVPEISKVQTQMHTEEHAFVSSSVRDSFNGRGSEGSNEKRVLARMVHRLRTGTYAKAIVAGEKGADHRELAADSACGIDANVHGHRAMRRRHDAKRVK